MPVALSCGAGACVAPPPGVGEERESEGPGTEQLRSRDGHLRSGGVLPIRVGVPADQPEGPEQGQGELTTVDDFVFGHLIEEDAAPIDACEGHRGKCGQRHLAVPCLKLEPSLHHRELAFGRGAGDGRRQWDMEPDPMVHRVVVEADRDANERLIGAKLECR